MPPDLPHRGVAVLIIEDHDDSRHALRQFVESLGAIVIEARDGREALERLALARPDVILCDLLLPGLDGFGFCQRLRRDPRYERIPLIAVTALSHDLDDLKTLETGFDAHLPKPIDYDDLAAVMSRVMSRRPAPDRDRPNRPDA
jgi:CheY-like chemotaxis protein